METSEECWSAEQLRLAEAQIEEQKRAWELKRLAALSGGDERNGTGAPSHDADAPLTYAHQDAANQVKRRPGRPRTKSNLNQSLASPASLPDATPPGGKRRGRRKKLAHTLSAPGELVKKEPDGDCTPDRPRRRRTATPGDAVEPPVDDCSPASGSSRALSPRTRSRGTVNINLWTLDVKPLTPGARASPLKGRDGASPVPETGLSNGDAANGAVPSKRARLASDPVDVDPDLDVVG